MENNYIAFHYRLPGDPVDPKAETQGSYKLFPGQGAAQAWVNHRVKKTATSPQGSVVLRADMVDRYFTHEVISWGKVFDCGNGPQPFPASLKLAIAAYRQYKSLPA